MAELYSTGTSDIRENSHLVDNERVINNLYSHAEQVKVNAE